MAITDPRVDEYLANLPAAQQALLQRVREHIRQLLPDATETISYGMPTFRLEGRFFVSYAGWKAHCSIYPLTDSFLAGHEQELEPFDKTKGSLHFTPERPLPDDLLSALITARRADLEAGRGY